MNQNIEKSEEIVDIEMNSYSFKDNPEIRKQYVEYVSRLNLKAKNKNRIIKASELSQFMSYENWAEELFNYCEKHFNEFLSRYGFIDLLDINVLLEKMSTASTKDIYLVEDALKTVYKASNINEFFVNDSGAIKKFREAVGQMPVSGINKALAKKSLEDCLDNIIKRLKKDINTTE